MHVPFRLTYTVLAAVLAGCGQQNPALDVDPKLGIDCFESHRASLPPGSQYEGIVAKADDRLSIKVMNGVELVTLECTAVQ